MQRQAITPVDEAARTLARTDRLPRPQRDDLNNAGLIQRQVGSRMNNRDDGLEQKLRRMLEDLRNFKITNPEAEQQMQNMLERLAMLRDRNVEPAEQGLTRAGKSLEQMPDSPPASRSAQNQPPGQGQQAAGKEQQGAKEPASTATSSRTPARIQRQQRVPARTSRAAKSEQGAGKKQQGDGSGTERLPKAQPRVEQSQGLTGRRRGRQARTRCRQGRAHAGRETGAGRSPLDSARKSLAEAKTNQKAIADELQKMLDGLSEFETYRGVVKDAQSLLKKQEETMKQSADAATKPDLMGKSAEALSPEQKAELGNLAGRQNEVAKGLQDLLERMDELSKRLSESDPLASSAMRDAAENSRKQGTSAKMGEAAGQLEKNQMGQARDRQEQARQELRELVDSVQNRRERELSRLVKELKKAEAEMRELRKRQAQNLKATREAKKNPNAKDRQNQLKKLAKEQAEIQQELKRQLQRLAKLNAERAGRAAGDAQGKMAKAQDQLDQDQGDDADKNEEEALADLNDAQDELENVRKEAEERLAMEQLARMGDQLKSMAERQNKMVTDIDTYENLRLQSNGKLTIAQRTGVRGLGQVQAGLKDETSGLVEQLEGAPVFSLTLKRAGESMGTVAERLQALKTDQETQKAVRSAAHRFDQLIDSLKADNAKQGGGGKEEVAAAGEAVAAGVAAVTESPRPPSSRCSRRSSRRSTSGPKRSTSCVVAIRSSRRNRPPRPIGSRRTRGPWPTSSAT